ncbi:MAG TPA: hypothetical protein DD435_08315, partial [Cyanobacteria bacterium UBA8530]|nr:hypothetical protein [Cyanobacteria bacterium UBA8530]
MMEKDLKTWNLEFGAQPELDLEADFASISVVPVEPGGIPRIEANENVLERMRVEVSKDMTSVRVSLRQLVDPLSPRNWLDWGGNRKLTLFVPQGISARIHADAGKISIGNLNARRIDLNAEAGSILLQDVRADFHVRASAGKIEGDRLSGSLDLKSNAGTVRLRVDSLEPGTHRIHADVGSVRVEIARNAAVRVETSTDLGSVRNSFCSTPEAPAVLQISAAIGSVVVKEANATGVRLEKREEAPRREETPIASGKEVDQI